MYKEKENNIFTNIERVIIIILFKLTVHYAYFVINDPRHLKYI